MITIAQLQQELSDAGHAASVMQQEQEVLMQCIAAAEEVIALKDDKTAAVEQQLCDMERMFEASAQAASELEQELEQVTSLADVTQLQLDTATADAEASGRELSVTAAQLAAAVAKCEQLQADVCQWSQRAHDVQIKLSDHQQAALVSEASASAERQTLIEALSSKESEFLSSQSRADTLAASVDRLQQLLRDVQDSASAAEQRTSIAEELAREMYSHTQASVSVKGSSMSGTDDAVHELRGQVAALQQELQERSREQMEWLQEMDGMRRLIQVSSEARLLNDGVADCVSGKRCGGCG
jgi:chromosome segregation ATPase